VPAAIPVALPETVTGRPALEGFGEATIVSCGAQVPVQHAGWAPAQQDGLQQLGSAPAQHSARSSATGRRDDTGPSCGGPQQVPLDTGQRTAGPAPLGRAADEVAIAPVAAPIKAIETAKGIRRRTRTSLARLVGASEA